MKKPLGTVIRELREQRGLTQGELADAPDVDLDAGNLSRFERGLQSIALPKLEAIAKCLGVAMSEIYAQAESGQGARYAVLDDRANGGLVANDHTSPANEYLYVTRVKGPHLSAGTGEVVWDYEEIEHSHAFRRDWMQKEGYNPRRCKLLDVRGDSMTPTVKNGDMVMINMADREVASGELFALICEDGLRIKRLHRRSGGIWMHSDNPDQLRYPPELIEDHHAAIIGRVVWRGGAL